MTEIDRASFQIIAAVGGARSCFIDAIHAAGEGDFDRAQKLMDEGEQQFLQGHDAHTELIQQEAGGDPVHMTLIITHAEDQLMSAESFKIIANEMIAMYKRFGSAEA